MTVQQARQEVAKEMGYDSWKSLVIAGAVNHFVYELILRKFP